MHTLYKGLLLVIVLLSSVQAISHSQILQHNIKKGDTLFSIAKRYHSNYQDIQKENNLRHNEILHIGQIIQIPSYTESPKTKKHKILQKDRSQIISLAKTKLGRRYVWGASGKRNTYDCSGFTNYVYKKTGITIPRTSINQSKVGKQIAKNKLKKGDLIFFDTSRRRKGYVNHVGIYLGNNTFIHASSTKKKIVISKLENFYLERYKGARRPL
jgi:cell wall-associated NlpC family hydrolase